MSKRCGYVALAGRPNSGKSTFLNRVLQEKISIVSDKPQTTRHRILGVYHSGDLQIGFFDLPGIHKPKHTMNRNMMHVVKEGFRDADLIYHFVDVTEKIGSGDRFAIDMLRQTQIPVIVVANKIDLVNKSKLIPVLESWAEATQGEHIVPISALHGDNLDRLLEVSRGYLPEGDFIFGDDMLTDRNLSFLAQEFVREKILHFTRQEIPHASAVKVEQFVWDEESQQTLVAARIFVEKPSQRRILLGRGGNMIKKIRESARRALKQLIGGKVSLELHIKVAKDWRNQDDFLADVEP